MGEASGASDQARDAQEEPFNVRVATLSGETKTLLGCLPSTTMAEFRQIVSEEFGVRGHEMCLCLGSEAFVPDDDLKKLSELGIAEGSELLLVIVHFVRDLVGKWAPAPEDGSQWMRGMTIFEDGTFHTKLGQIKDGLVRVLSHTERKINLKRTFADSNDHVFTVEEDNRTMRGRCLQSGCTYTLSKIE
mmetsp:Transcript_25949/g.80956  ORF Transcript_25949/g.80956 Transcript_25949/m.80956 type:complete len:189 (-) Transcript_25949:173-739(-)